jgi:hypothetical protein
MTRIVTTHYRYKPPPRKKQAVPLTGPAVVTRRARATGTPKTEPTAVPAQPPTNDDRKPAPKKPAIVTTTSKKRLALERADRARDGDHEVSPEVKAFFARMIRPGGALPPEKP